MVHFKIYCSVKLCSCCSQTCLTYFYRCLWSPVQGDHPVSPGPKANPLSPEVRPMQVWELGILKRGRKWHLSVLCLLCQKKEKLRSLSDNKTDPQNRAQDWGKPRFLLKWKLSICDLFLKQHVRVRKLAIPAGHMQTQGRGYTLP